MVDRESLARSVQLAEALIDDGAFEVGAHWHVLVAAARERLAQLPEKCPNTEWHEGDWDNCPEGCRDGKVYPAELVERIAQEILDGHYGSESAYVTAVAVLDSIGVAPE